MGRWLPLFGYCQARPRKNAGSAAKGWHLRKVGRTWTDGGYVAGVTMQWSYVGGGAS